MASNISELAGKPAPPSLLVSVTKLVDAYYTEAPDAQIPAQRVMFGTSGHRGSSLTRSFNEWHVLAIAQSVCNYRTANDITGPLFLGVDTHALSAPACMSVLEVLSANGVDVMLAVNDEYTPTPAISHAIVNHNRRRSGQWADGIVVTPSHNPPGDGGIKYNPPNGGPAGQDATGWIQTAANNLLATKLTGVQRAATANALRAATTHRYDFLNAYVGDLGEVIDMDVIRAAQLHIGVDPLGGAGVHYWAAIAERYRLDLSVLSEVVDATFAFMPLDWDGQIRMDPSSPFAMQRLIDRRAQFDIAFACDTDHDRHGIVTKVAGLLPSNHFLCVAIDYLFKERQQWGKHVAIGKTVVSTAMIDRLAARLGRAFYEVPVGFKWFTTGLQNGALGFCGEESAGATFLRRAGSLWTTDKDGIIAGLLAAEITARRGRDLGTLYADLASEFGNPIATRVAAPATAQQQQQLAALSPQQIHATVLAGEAIDSILSRAPGNDTAIGGIKVIAASGWFAARPSGTEPIYKIYAESFNGPEHLQRIVEEAQQIVAAAIR